MNRWPDVEEAAHDAGLPHDWFLGKFGDTEDALRLFRLERVRQVVAEGYKPEHDDRYVNGELLAAAQCYVLAAFVHGHGVDLEGDHMPTGWPWAPEHWKPNGGPLSCIVKAGALMLAELERRKRAEAMNA